MMRIMKLNIDKIKSELTRIGKNQSWLANKLGVSRQRVSSIFRMASLKNAERIGKVLDIEPRDLIR